MAQLASPSRNDLHLAAFAGDVQSLRDILSGKRSAGSPPNIDVNRVDESGYTALMYAAKCGHAESVSALLESGASVQTQSKDGRTAIDLAGSELIRSQLLQSAPKQRSQNGEVIQNRGISGAGAQGGAVLSTSSSSHLGAVVQASRAHPSIPPTNSGNTAPRQNLPQLPDARSGGYANMTVVDMQASLAAKDQQIAQLQEEVRILRLSSPSASQELVLMTNALQNAENNFMKAIAAVEASDREVESISDAIKGRHQRKDQGSNNVNILPSDSLSQPSIVSQGGQRAWGGASPATFYQPSEQPTKAQSRSTPSPSLHSQASSRDSHSPTPFSLDNVNRRARMPLNEGNSSLLQQSHPGTGLNYQQHRHQTSPQNQFERNASSSSVPQIHVHSSMQAQDYVLGNVSQQRGGMHQSRATQNFQASLSASNVRSAPLTSGYGHSSTVKVDPTTNLSGTGARGGRSAVSAPTSANSSTKSLYGPTSAGSARDGRHGNNGMFAKSSSTSSAYGNGSRQNHGMPKHPVCGVGLRLVMDRRGDFMVTEVTQGGGAYDTRMIRPGDCLVGVAGKSIRGMQLVQVAGLISGPEGSVAEVSFRRGSNAYTVRVVRKAPKPQRF